MPLGRLSRTFGICWWGFPSFEQGFLREAFVFWGMPLRCLGSCGALNPSGTVRAEPVETLGRATQSEPF